MTLVLIIDDLAAMREQYAYDLQRLGGFRTLTADGGGAGLSVLETEPVDCVLLDLEMPGVDGFEVLATMKKKHLDIPVVVYTGTGNYRRCVRAVKLGAYGFLAKDEPMERVVHEIENAVAWSRMRSELGRLRREAGHTGTFLGESPAAVALREQITRLAAIPSSVLVTGESGSGKELAARGLHEAGPRARGPFIAVNCAALPETMFESELFGHERGAYTGADRARRGAFETAHGGTLFLDEIGETPLPLQAKLLRVLETGTVTRLGSHQPVSVDVRVVAATNRDLEAEVAAGRFRQDLLYRLNIHALRVPPLRERLGDVPLLAEHFLQLVCEKFGIPPRRFTPQALAALQAHDWARNNVRELRNTVERMVIAVDGPVLDADAVPADIRSGAPGGPDPAGVPARPQPAGTLKELKQQAERGIILAALERNRWHITNTARELGLADHSSLLKIMRRHGIRK